VPARAVHPLARTARPRVTGGARAGRPAKVRVYLGQDFAGGGEPVAFQDPDPFGGAVLAAGVYVG
jgi:hypothetical protein